MAQSSSGDSVVTRKKVVTSQPFVIQTGDATLKAWLDSLTSATGYTDPDFVTANDLYEVADSAALWAARVLNSDPTVAGSCYIVSAEVAKRIEAGRY